MGGKVWTEKEERMFWLQIIPQSPKRAGTDKANPEKSWKELAKEMQARLGPNAQRKYTALMLFEHFFQNAVNRKFSPKARRLTEAYIAKQDPEERQQQKMTRRRLLQSFDSGGSRSSSGSGSSSTPSPRSSDSEEDQEPAPVANAPAYQVSLPSFNQLATSATGYYDMTYNTTYPQAPYNEYNGSNEPKHYNEDPYGYAPNVEYNPYSDYAQYPM